MFTDTGKQRRGHIFENGRTTTTLLRTFQDAQEFTKFVRALILITNEEKPQEFQLAQGVVRSLLVSVDSSDPAPRVGKGKLQAPLKASVQLLEEERGDSDAAYAIEHQNYLVTENPVLASFYFG